jgi:hypothetical protein
LPRSVDVAPRSVDVALRSVDVTLRSVDVALQFQGRGAQTGRRDVQLPKPFEYGENQRNTLLTVCLPGHFAESPSRDVTGCRHFHSACEKCGLTGRILPVSPEILTLRVRMKA